jgi:hypothetical protein
LHAVLPEESIALIFGENQIVNELKFRNIGQHQSSAKRNFVEQLRQIAHRLGRIKETNLQKKEIL